MLTRMSADALIQNLTWALFVLIALRAAVAAIRRPTWANIDITLVFATCLLVIVLSVLGSTGLLAVTPSIVSIVSTALIALPFLLLRLMDDTIGLPRRVTYPATVGFVVGSAVVWLMPTGRPPWVDALLLLEMVLVLGTVVVASVSAALRTHGVTRRRLTAVSLGSLCLALNFVAGNLHRWLPVSPDDARSLANVFGLATGSCYYLGFAPPRWLRRAWQEPELRAFLKRAGQLPRLPETRTIVRTLEEGALTSLGAAFARVGLWNEPRQMLQFAAGDESFDVPLTSDLPAAIAFRTQQPVFSPDTHYTPTVEAHYRFRDRARAVIAAPITAGEQRLGVLTVSAARAPIFADDDLALVQLLADQAAVILESRQLIDEAAGVRARELATRLKDDFLSAAAHDLKTPLTTLVMQSQILERRAERNPAAPVDREALRRLTRESERLRAMVLELLDAARAEAGRLIGRREPVDLTAIACEVAARYDTPRHPVHVDAPGALIGHYDRVRITQLVENLVENAVKYSPDGGAVELILRPGGDTIGLRVVDHGIGIPPDDVPHLFERFHRGTNVNDRQYPGMGLGLYICHSIVVQHGGAMTVTSQPGMGSTFHVTLPSTPIVAEVAHVDHSYH